MRLQQLAHSQLPTLRNSDELAESLDEKIDSVGLEFVVGQGMLRTKLLATEIDRTANRGHVDAVLAANRSEDMRLDQVNERQRHRGGSSRLDDRFEEFPVRIGAVRHAGEPGAQRCAWDEKIMRSLGNAVRWEFPHILLVAFRHGDDLV
ncbi:hypothetical protein BH20VER1_BH20VER1_23170 [soil metagenome]